MRRVYRLPTWYVLFGYFGIAAHIANIQTSIHSALLARVHDTKAPVIQALYSEPSSILPILSASAESYIAAITQALTNDPPRTLIRAHLSFLASHFCIANPGLTSVIFDKCFFRFLLFSKRKKETAKATWEIIEGAKDGIGAYEVIQGCADDWRWHTDRTGGESIDVMANANMAIVARMAGQPYFVYIMHMC
jgi:U3 small nucleolar RNA-associated protein 10